jgi:hypothetical protein
VTRLSDGGMGVGGDSGGMRGRDASIGGIGRTRLRTRERLADLQKPIPNMAAMRTPPPAA